MYDGYIKLWRKSRTTAAFGNPVLWYVWTWCLMRASYQPQTVMIGYQKIELEPGQFVFGRKKAAAELKLSEKQIRTSMNALEKLQNVAIKTASKYSIVTVCNWATYQQDGPAKGQQNGQERAKKGPAKGHIQEGKERKEGEEGKNKDACPEIGSEPISAPPETPFIMIPLNDKTEHPIYPSDIAELKELYPAVDVEQEFRKMRGWILADPKRKKTKQGVRRFYTTWLSKEQDRGRHERGTNQGSGGRLERPKSEWAKPGTVEDF